MLSLLVDGKEMVFNSGYDMWIFAMLNKPKWFLHEKMTDQKEVADILRNQKTKK